MKKVMIIGMMMAMATGVAMGAEASASLDMASAYVFRGTTFNDGLVAQPGLKAVGLPVTLGLWGNLDLDDYDSRVDEGEFSEIDLYASYDLPLGLDPLALSVGYTEYTYPSGGGDADREVALTMAASGLLSPSLSVAYGVGGALEETVYLEAGVEHKVGLLEAVELALAATLAYAAPEDGDSGFSHVTASAGLSWSGLGANLTYIGQIDDDVLPDANQETETVGYDVEWMGSIGLSHSF